MQSVAVPWVMPGLYYGESMELVELSVEVDSESTEPVSEAFRRYGCRRIIVEHLDPSGPQPRLLVKAYSPNDDCLEKLVADMEVVVRLLGLVRCVGSLQRRFLQEEDWSRAWRKHYTIQRLGKRLVICPTWLSYEPEQHEVVVRLDPGMAFGTGVHPTTRMCLQVLDGLVKPGMYVADVGCGSGILAIAAAKLGASKALALDTDSLAIRVAQENVEANGISRAVEVVEGTLRHHPSQPAPDYDLIVANITLNPIVELASHIANSLATDGIAVLSGILHDQLSAVLAAFEPLGVSLDSQTSIDDWLTLVLRKP